MAILTADADAQDEATRRERRDRRQLSRHRYRMTQREQVHVGVDGELRMQREQERRLHESVDPESAEERDVVTDDEVVETRRDLVHHRFRT